MKKKITDVVLLLVVFILWGVAGFGSIEYQNIGLVAINIILSALIAYYLPIAVFREELHIVAYTWEILLGFMAFLWIFLDEKSDEAIILVDWNGILLVDSLTLAIMGFFFALINMDYKHS